MLDASVALLTRASTTALFGHCALSAAIVSRGISCVLPYKAPAMECSISRALALRRSFLNTEFVQRLGTEAMLQTVATTITPLLATLSLILAAQWHLVDHAFNYMFLVVHAHVADGLLELLNLDRLQSFKLFLSGVEHFKTSVEPF